MTTTMVRDSIVGDDWIRQTALNVPISRKIGDDGLQTGDIITGPVRLAFDQLFTLPPKQEGESEPKYGASLLFTPMADPNILYEDYYAWCAREFPTYRDPQTGQYNGLHSPFHDQAEKSRFGGFTPGCFYINSSSQYKPPVVDTRFNPIIDPAKVYPGVWAICAIRPYSYGKDQKGGLKKKGIGFGLQSVMIIGDDTRFGGGPADSKALFAGVNVTAPVVRPAAGNLMPPGATPPPPAGLPGYTAAQPAAAPGYQMPQTTYTPPAGYAAPPQAAPQTYAPPAITSPTETEDQRMMREMGLA